MNRQTDRLAGTTDCVTEVMQKTGLAGALLEDEDWANLHLHRLTLLWVGAVGLELLQENAADGSGEETCRG